MNAAHSTKTAAQGKNRTLVNFLSLSLLQIGNYVLPIVTLPIISRIIGPENYGLINYIFAYVYYFVLFINAGFDVYGIRAIIGKQDDPEAVNAIVSRIMVAKFYIMAACAIVFAIIIAFVSQLTQEKLVCLFAFLYCLGWVINPSWVYHAMQETKKFAIFSFFAKLAFSVAIVVVVRERSDYIYHPLITSLAHVGVSFFSLRYALRRYGIRLNWSGLKQVKETLLDIRHISVMELIRNQAHLTNIILTGTLLSIHDTGLYTAGLRTVIIAQTIVSMPLNTVLFPYIGRAFLGSEEEGMDRVRRILPYVFALTILMSLCTLIFAEPAIAFIFGKEFSSAVNLLRVFSFGLLFSNLNYALGQQVMLNLKKEAPYVRFLVVGLIFNIVLLFVLAKPFGVLGAALCWPLAELLVFGLLLGYFRSRSISLFNPEYCRPRVFYLNALKLMPFHK
ncbi:MAG: flippase [Sphingobacteriales bacterium]|nr:MAG: flippase [Sphingobacteriales bacterium]